MSGFANFEAGIYEFQHEPELAAIDQPQASCVSTSLVDQLMHTFGNKQAKERTLTNGDHDVGLIILHVGLIPSPGTPLRVLRSGKSAVLGGGDGGVDIFLTSLVMKTPRLEQ